MNVYCKGVCHIIYIPSILIFGYTIENINYTIFQRQDTTVADGTSNRNYFNYVLSNVRVVSAESER